jgi:chorismate mutase-like protein
MPASRRSVLLLGLVIFAGFLPGCAQTRQPQAFAPTPAESQLVEAMARRLDLARHVAWVKFQNNLPVSDPKREAELLASLVEKGQGMGLSSETVTGFFVAQIAASRNEQEDLIRAWKRGATLPVFPPWDLKRHIRPRLDTVSNEMLNALRSPLQPGFGKYAYSILRQRGFSRAAVSAAVGPLP